MSHRVTSSLICLLLSLVNPLREARGGGFYQVCTDNDTVSYGLDTRFDVQNGLLDHFHDVYDCSSRVEVGLVVLSSPE